MKNAVAITAFVLSLVALGACDKPATTTGSRYAPALAADAAPSSDKVLGGNDEVGAEPEKPQPVAGGPQLAYDYGYSFLGSSKSVETLRQADQAACERAGMAECQMINAISEIYQDSDSGRKSLELRVSPAWLKRWQGGLEASVAKAHARITQERINSEDLSLQIVDVSARLKNKLALRDRLQDIIRTSKGKISDLVEAETQLSQVQADIESAQSQLAVMQKRVATVHLTLDYESEAGSASHSVFAPVTDAWNGILRNMMLMVSLLITAVAFLVPLAIIVVPLVWWFLKRRKAKKALKD